MIYKKEGIVHHKNDPESTKNRIIRKKFICFLERTYI